MPLYIDMRTLEVVSGPRRQPKRHSYEYTDLDGQKHKVHRDSPRNWSVRMTHGCTAHFSRRMDAKAFIESSGTKSITGTADE